MLENALRALAIDEEVAAWQVCDAGHELGKAVRDVDEPEEDPEDPNGSQRRVIVTQRTPPPEGRRWPRTGARSHRAPAAPSAASPPSRGWDGGSGDSSPWPGGAWSRPPGGP